MKALIASDIHGRKAAMAKLGAVIDALNPDRIILLGDYLYNGPRNGVPGDYDPMAVCRELNRHAGKIVGVRGNCDSRIDQSLLKFDIEDSKVVYFNGYRIDLIHGDLLTSDLLHVSRGDILMYGHTHIPMLKKQDGVVYLNPGSVSFPKNGFPPSYAVFEEREIQVLPLDGGEPIYVLSLA